MDGYAPFCKHLFVPNFANVECGYVALTEDNKNLLRCCYESRNEGELPVLVSYFEKKSVEQPKATYLDVILYSKEQIELEHVAMGKTPPVMSAPWGIISIKSQMCDYELPMQPITMYVFLTLLCLCHQFFLTKIIG